MLLNYNETPSISPHDCDTLLMAFALHSLDNIDDHPHHNYDIIFIDAQYVAIHIKGHYEHHHHYDQSSSLVAPRRPSPSPSSPVVLNSLPWPRPPPERGGGARRRSQSTWSSRRRVDWLHPPNNRSVARHLSPLMPCVACRSSLYLKQVV